MENYSQLVIMLPCHSLEDFPLHHEGEEAQGLLANWTAMFHPLLVHSAGAMPTWARVDDPPAELSGKLLLIPSVSEHEIPAGFAARAKNEGAIVIRGGQDREQIIAQALSEIAAAEKPHNNSQGGGMVADFLALGYCFLQVELLTRQMRYASNLDEVYFNNQLIAAAAAYVDGDETKTRDLLQSCFDVLGEERDHFYPVDAFLMDLTLVADTTLGDELRDELRSGHISNLLISGETLEQMAAQDPDTLAILKTRLEEKAASLVGGEYDEGPAALLDNESLLAELRRGLATYEKHLGIRPTVFGRRRFGLAPWLPQLLVKTGFRAAMHATFEGGQFPDGSQTKTMWEGQDGTEINALARPPLDATKPETFLNFCMKMGESMDSDHVATLYFAHWPGQASCWFDDLRRIARWGPALGKFTTMDEYFQEADSDGLPNRFEADDYRSPYLKQAIVREEANAISGAVERRAAAAADSSIASLHTLTSLLTGSAGIKTGDSVPDAVKAFSNALPHADADQCGYLVANTHSFVRRVCVPTPELENFPAIERPVYAAGESEGQKHVVVDVPPMGFAWISGDETAAPNQQKPLVDDEGVLRNEFFEVRFDETTGAMRSLHDYANRGNRLSQRLALRMPAKGAGEETGPGYSVMVAESIKTTLCDAAVGEITTSGKLVDREGRELAGFLQRYRAVRGSRVLQIEIELQPQQMPASDPWNSYYACRFAWADEAANFHRSVGGARESTHSKRLEAPSYIEFDVPKQRTAILTGGLPYHRRVGMRKLDSILIVQGEQARKFRLGVGIDVTHPLQEALSLVTPPTALFQRGSAPSGPSSSWLFHIDSKNVVATHWAPVIQADTVQGFRVRLLEGYGRAAKVTLSCFRNVSSAQRVDFLGEPLGECEVSGDKVSFEMGPREWAELEVHW